MPEIPAEAVQRLIALGDMRIQIVQREINQGALSGLGSEISEYAAALVVAALDSFDFHTQSRELDAEQGYILVARQDLAETVEDARSFNTTMLGGDDATTARLNRLRAVLSGTLHPPHGPEIDSAPPATREHAGTPPEPPSVRTSPPMSDTDPTSNPRNEADRG